jgi:hypothetical protein
MRVQSATLERPGQDTQGDPRLHLEPAGANCNRPDQLRLLASYRFVGSGATAEARALNLFDSQTQTSIDSVKYTDTNWLSVPPYVAPGTILNSFFGTGNGFAPGRRVVPFRGSARVPGAPLGRGRASRAGLLPGGSPAEPQGLASWRAVSSRPAAPRTARLSAALPPGSSR